MADEQPKKSTRSRRYDYFDDADVAGNLAGSIVRGSTFVFGSSIAKFLIGLGCTAVLARLLNPEAYGLLAMVFIVTNFLLLFRDMNLSLATVQKERITHAQVSTIYWLNVAITFVIALAMLTLAPAVAWLYSEPRLTGIAMLLTVSVVIRGFAAQHQALLRRKMRFGSIGMIEIGSMLAGYVAAIALAWRGYGYWSLVWLHISTAVADLILCWVATGWRPSRPVRGSGVRAMLAFGTNLTGYSIFRFVSRSLDNAIIGWFWGAGSLGIYAKSGDTLGPLTTYLSSPFGAVAIPALSRITGETERYRKTLPAACRENCVHFAVRIGPAQFRRDGRRRHLARPEMVGHRAHHVHSSSLGFHGIDGRVHQLAVHFARAWGRPVPLQRLRRDHAHYRGVVRAVLGNHRDRDRTGSDVAPGTDTGANLVRLPFRTGAPERCLRDAGSRRLGRICWLGRGIADTSNTASR